MDEGDLAVPKPDESRWDEQDSDLAALKSGEAAPRQASREL